MKNILCRTAVFVVMLMSVCCAASAADGVEVFDDVTENSQPQYEEKIKSFMYAEDGVTQIKSNITGSVSVTLPDSRYVYSGTAESLTDGDITTSCWSKRHLELDYTVTVGDTVPTDFFVYFGRWDGVYQYDEIRLDYTDGTGETVFYRGANGMNRFFIHVDLTQVVPQDKTLKSITVLMPEYTKYKDENGNEVGEIVEWNNAMRSSICEVVLLGEYVEPLEPCTETVPSENPADFFAEFEETNDGFSDYAFFGRIHETVTENRNKPESSTADFATDGDFDTAYSISDGDGTRTVYEFDSPIFASDVFMVFDLSRAEEESDRIAENNKFRYTSIVFEYSDGTSETVRKAQFYSPEQITHFTADSSKQLKRIVMEKLPVSYIKTQPKPSNVTSAEYDSDGTYSFEFSELKIYGEKEQKPTLNVAYGKKVIQATQVDAVVRGNIGGLTDGYKLDELNPVNGYYEIYAPTSSCPKAEIVVDLEGYYDLMAVEVYGQPSGLVTSESAAAKMAGMTVTGSMDGKSFNIELGTTQTKEELNAAAGDEKSTSVITLSKPTRVRYIKLTADGWTSYTALSEIRTMAQKTDELFSELNVSPYSASTKVKNYSDAEKDYTLCVIQYDENGHMTGISTDYKLIPGRSCAELSVSYSLAEATKTYTAYLLDNLGVCRIIGLGSTNSK